LYLSNALGIVFIHWFGWRIVPLIYINGATTLLIWGFSGHWLKAGILASHEPAIAITSWLLCAKAFPSKEGISLSTTDSFFRFVMLGIAIPVCVNSVYVYHYSFVGGDMEKVFLIWLSDFITILPISVALLYFFKSDSAALSITLRPDIISVPKRVFIEITITTALFIALSFVFPFDRYWFIYGIGATLLALKRGFEATIVLNIIIFLLTYLLPLFDFASPLLISGGSTQYTNVHLGMGTMMFISILVGRAVSDLKSAEERLVVQKDELEKINNQLTQTNQELDRFVYSVSHDLSAPLKSIRGLVNVSRIEQQSPFQYLDKIEKSVNRLEDFIGEVLDYSRTNRKQLDLERIDLTLTINDLLAKFEYMELYPNIRFIFDIQVPIVKTDSFLLRVVLSNLLSNAIKYQQKYDDHKAMVTIKSYPKDSQVVIEITDNGEGIQDAYQDKIFDMFYRGTLNSTGSGLGLYIAREAATKLKGRISMESMWGKGSSFYIHLSNASELL
jgi:signal transduction histidine kinase